MVKFIGFVKNKTAVIVELSGTLRYGKVFRLDKFANNNPEEDIELFVRLVQQKKKKKRWCM